MAEQNVRALLDAVLIIKNEQEHLPSCLRALSAMRPVLGQICVYDTGSSDNSVSICESYGARVEQGYWNDDFARARNDAALLSGATWNLHIDADETAYFDVLRLKEILVAAREDVDVFHFIVRSWSDGSRAGDASIGRLLRRSACKFVGRVHEHATSRVVERELRVALLPQDIFMVSHLGYSGRHTLKRKALRNVAISEAEVGASRQPGVAESELQLALTHRARANAALGNWDLAESDLREVRDMPSNLGTRRYAGELLADRAMLRGELSESGALLQSIASEGSDPQWVRWKAACLALRIGNAETAWHLIRTVDEVHGAMGELIPRDGVLYDRTRIAVASERPEEAVATALVLVGRYARTEGVRVLVHACATWNPGTVAELLAEQASTFHPAVFDELVRAGRFGESIARRYRALLLGGDEDEDEVGDVRRRDEHPPVSE